jgi:hypothetical protein
VSSDWPKILKNRPLGFTFRLKNSRIKVFIKTITTKKQFAFWRKLVGIFGPPDSQVLQAWQQFPQLANGVVGVDDGVPDRPRVVEDLVVVAA